MTQLAYGNRDIPKTKAKETRTGAHVKLQRVQSAQRSGKGEFKHERSGLICFLMLNEAVTLHWEVLTSSRLVRRSPSLIPFVIQFAPACKHCNVHDHCFSLKHEAPNTNCIRTCPLLFCIQCMASNRACVAPCISDTFAPYPAPSTFFV